MTEILIVILLKKIDDLIQISNNFGPWILIRFNVWEILTATVEQFGVFMLTGKPKTFHPEPQITLFLTSQRQMVLSAAPDRKFFVCQ